MINTRMDSIVDEIDTSYLFRLSSIIEKKVNCDPCQGTGIRSENYPNTNKVYKQCNSCQGTGIAAIPPGELE